MRGSTSPKTPSLSVYGVVHALRGFHRYFNQKKEWDELKRFVVCSREMLNKK